MSDLEKAENVNSDGGPVKDAVVTEPPNVETEQPSPTEHEKSSPKKRGATDNDTATAKKKRSPTKVKQTKVEAGDGEDEVVAPETPRKRKASGNPATPGRSIPASIEEADEADRTLLRMKDAGSGWPEIRAAWKNITGETNIGTSTLPNRYNRLKANFIQFTEEDSERLQAAKIDVEAKFNTEKWAKIAEAMEAMGSQKFSTAIIQKKLKELEKKVED